MEKVKWRLQDLRDEFRSTGEFDHNYLLTTLDLMVLEIEHIKKQQETSK